MRRLAPIAAFALVLAVPLWAQHGGGGHGGGHAGGFGAGSGARAFTPPSSSRAFSQHGFSNRGIASRGFRHDGFRGNRFRLRTYGFNNYCYGFPCRGGYYYPWAYGGYYDPYWWWDTGSNDDSYDQDVVAAAQMNRDNLEEQRMLRQEESDGDQDAYAAPPRAPRAMRPGNEQPGNQPTGAAMMSDTVLVFRDQHKQEVSNYAIVGQTLWNFAPGHTQKIPLSDLDLPATTKANQDVGVTFRVPGSSGEGQ